MQVKNTKYKIYKYAIQGYPQSKIASFLRIDKAYVNRVIKELIREGYIKPVCENTKPIIYEATNKLYPVDEKLTKSTSGGLSPRLNLIVLKYRILKPPEVKVDGKEWVANNTRFVDHRELFDEGYVTFRIINDKVLVVFMPEQIVDAVHIRHTRQLLYEKAQDYANWFQKTYRCQLGLPEIYQDYHIAFLEKDPFLNQMVQKYGMVKLVDCENRVIAWYDQSKGSPEFETRDERIAEIKAFLPVVVANLEDRLFDFENRLSALEMLFSSVKDDIGVLSERIENSVRKLDALIESLSNASSGSDSFIDVV